MAAPKIAVLVGSLRKASFNRHLAAAIEELAAGKLDLSVIEIGKLPFYDQDLETEQPPPAWAAFRDAVRPADGVLFVTAEYNRGVPGVLKNAIDVGSRPYGKSVWDKKPAAVISSSPGAIGGFGANHQLRQSLVFLQMPVLAHEAYIGGVNKLLDKQGALTSDDTRKFLGDFVETFAAFVARFRAA